MSPFLIRVQQAPSCGGTLCHPLLQTLWADGGNTDVEIVRRVAQSWEEHRFFPSTLQGETGAAHGEGNHGPHREFYTLHTKSFTLFYLFFFFLICLTSYSPSRFSPGLLLSISTDYWHVFPLDSHCIGGTQNKIFVPKRKVQTKTPSCNLSQKQSSPCPHVHTMSSCRRQCQLYYSSWKIQNIFMKI